MPKGSHSLVLLRPPAPDRSRPGAPSAGARYGEARSTDRGATRQRGKSASDLTNLIRRYPLIAYFVLTYAFTWGLFIPLQPVHQAGNEWAALLLSLGIFGPALVAIALSKLLRPRPRWGSRRAAVVTFLVAWPIAIAALLLQDWFGEDLDLTSGLVVGRLLVALLPAFVRSQVFSTVPGVRGLLSTYFKPPGASGYYVLALLLIPAI